MEGIVTSYGSFCIFCGKDTETEHHLLPGRGIRQLAEEDGIKIPMCHGCHTMGPMGWRIHGNIAAEKLSKMLGQLAWEKEYYRKAHEAATGNKDDCAREYFRERYGKSYL